MENAKLIQYPSKANPIQLNAAIAQINAATDTKFRAKTSCRIKLIQDVEYRNSPVELGL
jgi:hypothetical protein